MSRPSLNDIMFLAKYIALSIFVNEMLEQSKRRGAENEKKMIVEDCKGNNSPMIQCN